LIVEALVERGNDLVMGTYATTAGVSAAKTAEIARLFLMVLAVPWIRKENRGKEQR